MNIGIDLGGTKLLMLCGEVEERVETGHAFSPEVLVAKLRAFVLSHGIRPSGIGIAVPGLVDKQGGIAACDVLPKFAGWSANEALAGFGCPIAVINDVKAALAE